MSETLTIPLTDELRSTISTYLRARAETAGQDFWTMPMEIARRDVGLAFLEAAGLPVDVHAPIGSDELPDAPPRQRRAVIPFVVRARIAARDGFRCVTCGTDQNLTIDHKIPVSKGGTDDESNLQTMCGSCNSRKGAKLEHEP